MIGVAYSIGLHYLSVLAQHVPHFRKGETFYKGNGGCCLTQGLFGRKRRAYGQVPLGGQFDVDGEETRMGVDEVVAVKMVRRAASQGLKALDLGCQFGPQFIALDGLWTSPDGLLT